MSRIGNKVLTIPEGVTVTLENNTLTVKGPKGELKDTFSDLIKIEIKDNLITCKRINETKEAKSLHGTTNSLINNMLIGVKDGYEKKLETVGVGYRFNVLGKTLTVNAGYSNPVIVEVPEGIEVDAPSATELVIKGFDKQKVTEFAANIREIRKPEPYKGKGIRYHGEHVRRKEGKKAAK